MTIAMTVTRLFWHRGRRQFVDLTITDASRRLCLTEAQAKQKLLNLLSVGYAEHSLQKVGSETIMVWRASSAGRNLVVAHLDGGIA